MPHVPPGPRILFYRTRFARCGKRTSIDVGRITDLSNKGKNENSDKVRNESSDGHFPIPIPQDLTAT
jgi:hypothetical protein